MASYGQYCGLAKALDVVGDRWTLLIVRELLSRGPLRYTDLRDGLPGIATNLLASRLRELDKAGVLRREAAPPPIATSLFALTPRGEELRPVIVELGRWGVPLLADAPQTDAFRGHWLAWPVELFLRDCEPDGPPLAIQLHAGDELVVIESADGKLRTRLGRVERPDAVLSGSPRLVAAAIMGTVPLAKARAHGLRFKGNPQALRRLQPGRSTLRDRISDRGFVNEASNRTDRQATRRGPPARFAVEAGPVDEEVAGVFVESLRRGSAISCCAARRALRGCAFVIGSLLALSVVAGSARPRPTVLAIGVELPLAGDDAAAGLLVRSALELSVDDHNARRSESMPELRLLVRDAALHLANPHQDEGTDNAFEPQRAADLMRAFARGHVVAAIGGLRPNVAAAEVPVAKSLGLPLLVLSPVALPCAASRSRGDVGPTVFVPAGSSMLEARAVASFFGARGRRFAVLDDGEPARRSVATCLVSALKAAGGIVTLRASALPDEGGLARLRAEQRRTRSDVVMYLAPAERGTMACGERASELLETVQTLAEIGHRGYDPSGAPAGCRWIERRLPPTDGGYAAFVERYRQRYFEAPSDEAAQAYAAGQILTAALDRTSNAATTQTPAELRPALRRVLVSQRYDTILGTVRFDASGSEAGAWFADGSHAALKFIPSQSQ